MRSRVQVLPEQKCVLTMVAPLDVLVEVDLGSEGERTLGAGEHLSPEQLYPWSWKRESKKIQLMQLNTNSLV